MFRKSILVIVFSVLGLDSRGQNTFDVMVFSKTNGFRHSSIADGQEAIRNLSLEYGFQASFSEDSTIFTRDNLDTLEVVVFLNTTGDILGDEEQIFFEEFIENGGGFVGIHSATDTEYDWPWYGELIGRYFDGHPQIQRADLTVLNSDHESTMNLPSIWVREDEWYNFDTPFPEKLNVLVTIDENSYSGGTMGDFHPISWFHEIENGRSFYTAMGHTKSTYAEPEFIDHLLGGIMWASKSIVTAIDGTSFPIQFLIYPNPASNNIQIRSLKAGTDLIAIKVYTLEGNSILDKRDLLRKSLELDISRINSGIYILEVQGLGESFRYRLLVK